MMDMNALIRSADEIEPLPATVARLITLTGDDNWSWPQVVDLIRLDPIMASRVLRVANSAAFYSSHGPIVKIDVAAKKLGISNILTIVMAGGVRGLMNEALPEFGWEKGQLWRNAVAASLVPEVCAGVLHIEVPGEATTAALLHNIGAFVMRRFIHSDEFGVLLETWAADGNLFSAEKTVFNINHAEVGGMILKKWKMPENIVKSVTYHHQPNPTYGKCADVVYLSCKVATKIIPPTRQMTDDALDAGVCERLGVTDEHFNTLVTVVSEYLDELISLYA